jgi:hypothetical protein
VTRVWAGSKACLRIAPVAARQGFGKKSARINFDFFLLFFSFTPFKSVCRKDLSLELTGFV